MASPIFEDGFLSKPSSFAIRIRLWMERHFSLAEKLDTVGNVIPLIVSRFSELSPASAGTRARQPACHHAQSHAPFPFAWQASERAGELSEAATIPAQAGLDSLKRPTIQTGTFSNGFKLGMTHALSSTRSPPQ
jgi:hypothetical protein